MAAGIINTLSDVTLELCWMTQHQITQRRLNAVINKRFMSFILSVRQGASSQAVVVFNKMGIVVSTRLLPPFGTYTSTYGFLYCTTMTMYWPNATIDQLLGRFFIEPKWFTIFFIINDIEALIGSNRNNGVARRTAGDKKEGRHTGNKPCFQEFTRAKLPGIKN